jgi:hypothetical protein
MRGGESAYMRLHRLLLATSIFLAASSVSLRAEAQEWVDSMPGMNPGLIQADPIDIVLDGETFRNYFEAVLDGVPEQLPNPEPKPKSAALQFLVEQILPLVSRVHLIGTSKSLNLEFRFAQSFDAFMMPKGDAHYFKVYGFRIPEEFTLQLRYAFPELILSPVGDVQDIPSLFVKIPLLRDQVFLHYVKFNPIASEVKAKAGILWDLIRITKTFPMHKDSKASTLATHDKLGRTYGPLLAPLANETWDFPMEEVKSKARQQR